MSRRRIHYPTRYAVGPYQLVTLRRRRGYAILDSRTGRWAYTERAPNNGRNYVPVLEDLDRALTIAASL